MFPRWLRGPYYACRDWLMPRNEWATKIIPNHWSDKTALIPEFLYAAIIDFVEGEDALNTIVWDEKEQNEILECYNWAKYRRFNFKTWIDISYPKLESEFPWNCVETGKTYEELYGEVNRLEKIYEETETKYLTWMIVNRGILWT